MHYSIALQDKAHQRKRTRGTKGASLIELMICMGMITLLGVLSGPSLRALATRNRVITAEHALIGSLQLARSTAITRREEVILCPSLNGVRCSRSSDWTTGWLLFLDTDGDREPNIVSDIIRTDTFPATALHIIGSGGRQFIRYLPDGRSAGTNLTISICEKNGAVLKQIVVNNAGRVRSQRPKETRNCPR